MHVLNNYDRDKMEDKLERKKAFSETTKIKFWHFHFEKNITFVFKICKIKW